MEEETGLSPMDRAAGKVDEQAMLDKEVRPEDRLGDLRQREGVGHRKRAKVEVQSACPESPDLGAIGGVQDT